MYRKRITYEDFDGTTRTEEFLFNMTETELTKWSMETSGGMLQQINRITDSKNEVELFKLFDEIIDRSYGIKTPNGRGFVKTPEALADFKATEAYNLFYMELVTDAKVASDFVNGVVPAKLREKARAAAAAKQATDNTVALPQ